MWKKLCRIRRFPPDKRRFTLLGAGMADEPATDADDDVETVDADDGTDADDADTDSLDITLVSSCFDPIVVVVVVAVVAVVVNCLGALWVRAVLMVFLVMDSGAQLAVSVSRVSLGLCLVRCTLCSAFYVACFGGFGCFCEWRWLGVCVCVSV